MKIITKTLLILFAFQGISQSSTLKKSENIPDNVTKADSLVEPSMATKNQETTATDLKKKPPKRVFSKDVNRFLQKTVDTVADVGAMSGSIVKSLFQPKEKPPEIKKDDHISKTLDTHSGGTLQISANLSTHEIKLIHKSSLGKVLEKEIFFSNIDSSKERFSKIYLGKMYTILHGIPSEKELFTKLSQILELD
ncbi:hypothetical protein AB834_04380 [PVC group bacterium (ex Bugula neritina AB1)]|nr:hypothetical protein AB834_04380 [PVC group bacterium (ex Bugula neritina AB1)]